MSDSSVDSAIENVLSSTEISTENIIQFYHKSDDTYHTNHPYIKKSFGSILTPCVYNTVIKEILQNTNYIIEEYANNILVRKASQGNWSQFSDLMIDEAPHIRFGCIKTNKENGVNLSFYDAITNTLFESNFTDDDIFSHTFTIVSRENIQEIIYYDDLLTRPLNTMGIKPIKVKRNTTLSNYLSLKNYQEVKYNKDMLIIDNNIIEQCDLIMFSNLFQFKTIQGKRFFSTMIRKSSTNLDEIERKQKIIQFLNKFDASNILPKLQYFPDLMKIIKKIEHGKITINDIVFVFQILLKKEDILQTIENTFFFDETLFCEDEIENKENHNDFNSCMNQKIKNNDNKTSIQLDLELFSEEIITPLKLLNFLPLLNSINDQIDVQNSTVKCTNDSLNNILLERMELKNSQNEEIGRIRSIIKGKSKIDRYTLKIPRKDYDEKIFRKNNLLEKHVLKSGVVFTSRILNELEKKEIQLREIEILEEKKIINTLLNIMREYVSGMSAYNTIISMIDFYCCMALKLSDPDWSLPKIFTKIEKKALNEQNIDKITFNSNDDISGKRIQIPNSLKEIDFYAQNAFHPLVPECVKNNIQLKFTILTGPNTAGKSTFLKTITIIIILGQMGCPVPSSKCEFYLKTGIFIRSGASDKYGYSTFMLEMIDIARIIHNSNENSLVMIDELGRGTSSIDGISLCIAVKEHLMKMNSTSMFATHFNDNSIFLENIQELLCAETKNGIITYKMKQGIAKSLGIDVAKKVNFPTEVVELAEKYFMNEE